MNDANGYNRVQNTLAEDSDDEHENMRSPLLGGANGAARRGQVPLPPVSNWDFMRAILLEVSTSCRFPTVVSFLTFPRLRQHSDYRY
jgi:hypothetical protein